MRRRLYFDYSLAENSYIIQEDGSSIFRINGNTLKFVSLEFYNGVYAGNKSTAIDFENKIAENSSDPLKKVAIFSIGLKKFLKPLRKNYLTLKKLKAKTTNKKITNLVSLMKHSPPSKARK